MYGKLIKCANVLRRFDGWFKNVALVYFNQKVLEEAKKRNMGILALKAMARRKWQSEEDKKQIISAIYGRSTMLRISCVRFINASLVLLLLVNAASAAVNMTWIPDITATAASSWSIPPQATVDGSGLDEQLRHSTEWGAMWISNAGGGGSTNPHLGTHPGATWLKYEFDKAYELADMWVWNNNYPGEIDRGLKKVYIEYSTDNSTWNTLYDDANDYWIFAKSPGTDNYEHNTEVDFDGVSAKYVVITADSTEGRWGDGGGDFYALSELRFNVTPSAYATAPEPANRAKFVEPDVTLSWTPGIYAALHDVYLGTDFNDVNEATTASAGIYRGRQTANSFDPCGLELDTMYYWRIDEVNDPNIWKGEVWSFTVSKWERNEVNLLSGFYNMYNPHLVKVPGDPYPYKMYFFGWSVSTCNPGYSGCDSIYLARAQELTGPWTVYSGGNGWLGDDQFNLWVPIITADDKFYDEWHNGDPSVVKHNGIYYMAYSATGMDADGYHDGEAGDTDGYISVVMGATSLDGVNWTRSEYPILIYEPEIGQKEVYGNSSYVGNFHRPSLMWDEDHWRLWFDYEQPGPAGLGMGHAECYGDPMDFNDWTITHDLSTALILDWPNPDVMKIGDTYYSVADPGGYPGQSGWPSRQIKEAVSDDGINWTVLDFIPPDSDTPANHIPEGYIEVIDGQRWLYLFYACQVGGDPYFYGYDRIRAMRALLGPAADLDYDGDVDLADYAVCTPYWHGTMCEESNWCGEADLDQSGAVDFNDIGLIADYWLCGK